MYALDDIEPMKKDVRVWNMSGIISNSYVH